MSYLISVGKYPSEFDNRYLWIIEGDIFPCGAILSKAIHASGYSFEGVNRFHERAIKEIKQKIIEETTRCPEGFTDEKRRRVDVELKTNNFTYSEWEFISKTCRSVFRSLFKDVLIITEFNYDA